MLPLGRFGAPRVGPNFLKLVVWTVGGSLKFSALRACSAGPIPVTFDQINHASSAWPMQHPTGRWVANVQTSRKNIAANVTAFEDGGTSGVLDKIPDGGSRNHGRLG